MPDVQTAQSPGRESSPLLRNLSSLPSAEDPALAAAFEAADREAGQSWTGIADLSPPESRSAVWEDALGFPDGDFEDVEDYCAEIVLWLTDFSDAEEGLSNWTVFSEPHAA